MSLSPAIPPHTLHLLEFDAIRGMLAERATSSLGEELALALTPGTDIGLINDRLETVSECRAIIAFNDTMPIRGIKDIRAGLQRARIEGTVLDAEQMLHVGQTLQTSRLLHNYGAKLRDERPSPHVERLLSGLGAFPLIEEEINRAIDPTGIVKDSASPTLKRLRREQHTVRERTREELNRLVQSETGRQALQEQVVTVREGRYVVPVRTDHKSKITGVVHDQSASGATLFVEPFVVVELNNRLRELEAEERREIDRILGGITTMIRGEVDAIAGSVDLLQRIDFFYAAGRLSLDLRASPPLMHEDGQIELRNARHPMLELPLDPAQTHRQAVPLSIRVGGETSTLVITGPNMGGKTVALKTVGLLTLMAQCGLHVPADEPAHLSVFTRIFADIGDEQSIQANLSTFSSHLRNVITIINHADDRTLVLLDELGSGTDPTAGAALGMAVLESLTVRRTVTIATTHYGALKEFAARTPRVENGSMEFDVVTLGPTYRFRQGIPGGSYAIEIGQRLGMPAPILTRASDLIGTDERKLEELIIALDRERLLHEETRQLMEREQRTLTRLTAEYEEKLATLNRTERDLLRKAQERADSVLRGANAIIERTVADLRATSASKESIKLAKTAVTAQREEIRGLVEAAPPAPPPPSIAVGAEVWVETLQKRATIVALPGSGDRVRVRAGKVELTVRREDLRATDTSAPQAPAPARHPTPVQVQTTSRVKPDIDLRGYRADAALDAVDKYLDQAALEGLTLVRILHGKGTGALRHEIGNYLKAHDLVKDFYAAPQAEGGTGVTVVELV